MLMYYQPVFEFGNVYTIDSIRLSLSFLSPKAVNKFLDELSGIIGYTYYESYRDFSYRHLFVFGTKGHSFSLGVGFNGSSSGDSVKGMLDFNPNKILGDVHYGEGFVRSLHNPFSLDDMSYVSFCERVKSVFLDVWKLLQKYLLHTYLKRYDFAMDVPMLRSDVQLLKDSRKYSQFYKSETDFTEYLGNVDTVGRVKVYNKQLESGLNYPLTRVEITLDSLNYDEMACKFPQIYLRDMIQLDSDKVLVQLLRKTPSSDLDFYFRQMTRPAKKKFKAILLSKQVEIPQDIFEKVVNTLNVWIV